MNNTNGSTFDSIKLISHDTRSFGSTNRSLLQSTNETVLPEANYVTNRRARLDFDRHHIDDDENFEKCFGFDTDDDTEIEDTNKTATEAEADDTIKTNETVNNTNSISYAASTTLKDIRANLKRFLHNSDANSHSTASKQLKIDREKVSNKNKRNKVKSPIKEKSKKKIFNEPDAIKQKDIRGAFNTKPHDPNKDKAIPCTSKQNLPVLLFEETETVKKLFNNI